MINVQINPENPSEDIEGKLIKLKEDVYLARPFRLADNQVSFSCSYEYMKKISYHPTMRYRRLECDLNPAGGKINICGVIIKYDPIKDPSTQPKTTWHNLRDFTPDVFKIHWRSA